MDDFYTSSLYSEANELAHSLAGACGEPNMAFIYLQVREADEVRHYFVGFYRGPNVELMPSAATETYEMSHSGMRSYKDEHITGLYSVTVVHLGSHNETLRVNVHSLQGVGEEIHGIISEELGSIGEEASFNVNEMYFADTVVNLIADAEGENE